MFHGILKEVEDQRKFVGALYDTFGESELQEVKFEENEGMLEFNKYYVNSDSYLTYKLTKKEDLWEGTYYLNGRYETVKLFLIPIDEQNFFECPEHLEIQVWLRSSC